MNTMQLIKMKNAGDNEAYLTTNILNEAVINCNDMKNAIYEESNKAKSGKYDTDFLIDYIITTHHTPTKKNSIIIYDLTQKVAYRHSDQHCELNKFSEVVFFFFHDLLNQMMKEEQTLFPYIRQIIKDIKPGGKNDDNTSQSLEQKIKSQQIEQRKTFNYLKVFREITNDYQIPSDACSYYISLFEKMKELERDLTMHFHLEDDILFRLEDNILSHNPITAGKGFKQQTKSYRKN